MNPVFTRKRYQFGSFRKVERRRGPAVWEFRYRDSGSLGRPQRQLTLSTSKFPTEAQARRHVEALLWKLNSDTPYNVNDEMTFGTLADLFIEDEHLRDISKLKAGESNEFGTLKVSTAKSYLQLIETHIRPRWGDAKLREVKAAPVTSWLKEMKHEPLTKVHIRAVMSRMFKKAMLWELMNLQVNPMSLVEIRRASKRSRKPIVLTVEQCQQLVSSLAQPYKTMVLVGICTGLRVSEILALRWEDIDFDSQQLRVRRAVVRGIVDTVKTECSEDELPLDPTFSDSLETWKRNCPASADSWVFPSPLTKRPYEPGAIQQKIIREAGRKLGFGNLGWHSLRHTYRSLLDAAGAPVGVQQRLMRHAEISTTMNHYGNAQMDSKRQAHGKVVKMVLKDAVGFCGVASPAELSKSAGQQ